VTTHQQNNEIIITWLLILCYLLMSIKYLLIAIINKPWILKFSADFSLLYGDSRYFSIFLTLLSLLGFLYMIQHILYDINIYYKETIFSELFDQIKYIQTKSALNKKYLRRLSKNSIILAIVVKVIYWVSITAFVMIIGYNWIISHLYSSYEYSILISLVLYTIDCITFNYLIRSLMCFDFLSVISIIYLTYNFQQLNSKLKKMLNRFSKHDSGNSILFF
jgi:hypothetical protein